MSTIPDVLWSKFARFTVQTQDLDPMYDLIYKARLKYGDEWAERYALAFFLFYDAGQAADIANDYDFWGYIKSNIDKLKRGTERRHFRGEKAHTAITRMSRMGNAGTIWETMHSESYSGLRANIEVYFHQCQIGHYFIWKAMDLMDRCLNMSIRCTIDEALLGLPDEPREAAKHFFPELTPRESLEKVKKAIEEMNAPGEPNRRCAYPEAETVLCMMKGYFKTKTHTIGDDVDEKHKQLTGYPFLKGMLPPQLNWNSYEQAMESTRLSIDRAGVCPEE